MPLTAVLRPKCAELTGQYVGNNHTECWDEIANQSGCYWWNTHYHSVQTTGWSGRCRSGLAKGFGVLSHSSGGHHSSERGTGKLVNGKTNGQWTERYASGTVDEGPYVDGKRQGRWIIRFPSGGGMEQEYRDGSRDGQPGVYVTKAGERHPGKWSGHCFRDRNGRVRAWDKGNKESCAE